jgi:uncharacterized OsmC-like protein
MSAAAPSIVNGVNVDQLVGIVGAIQSQPELARFRFRATTRWVDGGRTCTTIQGFHGAGAEDASRVEPFVLEGDEPPVLLGTNAGPNAVEALLHALGSCLAVGLAYSAAARRIRLERLELGLEGDVDLHGFLGLSETVRPGCESVRVACRLEADAPREQIEELVAHVQKTSPLLDVVRNPMPVEFRLEA